MEYLSHTDAVKYVQQAAGLSREVFDDQIRPRLRERAFGRLIRFKRLAIDKAIDDPTYSENGEGHTMLRRTTVADALDAQWQDVWQFQKGARKQKSVVAQCKLESIASVPLRKLEYDQLAAWVRELRAAKLGEATIARRLSAVMTAIQHPSVKKHLKALPEKPTVQIDNEHERYYTRDEEERLLQAARARPGEITRRVMPYVQMALADIGCRVSELIRIRTNDVYDDGVIFRDRKAGAANIKVPLTGRARRALGELLADPWWQHWTRDAHDRDRERKAVAVENLQSRLTHEFTAIRDDAGVPDGHLHIYRHTCLTRLVEAGMDIGKVQKWAGHSDIRTTVRRYAHYAPNALTGGEKLLESHESHNVVDLEKRRILEQ